MVDPVLFLPKWVFTPRLAALPKLQFSVDDDVCLFDGLTAIEEYRSGEIVNLGQTWYHSVRHDSDHSAPNNYGCEASTQEDC